MIRIDLDKVYKLLEVYKEKVILFIIIVLLTIMIGCVEGYIICSFEDVIDALPAITVLGIVMGALTVIYTE